MSSNLVASALPNLHQQNSRTESFIADPALGEAIKKYAAGLTEKEKIAFDEQSAKSPQELISRVKALDESHKNTSTSRQLAPGVEKVLNTIGRFMDILTACVQYSPECSSLILGGFKCILQLALDSFRFFQKLSDMVDHIEDHLSYLCRYAEPMFQKSVHVQEALVKVYCDLLEFCTQTRRIFTDDEGEKSRSASFKIFQRLPWDSYETRLREIQLRFSGHANVVFRAAQVQGMIDENTERQWVRLRADIEDARLRDEKRRTAFKWLSSIDFEETHQRHFAKRFGSTGEWLLNDRNYETWRDCNESCLLWCYGAPGAGKTILSSLVSQTLLEKFSSSDNIGVAYAYCSYIELYEPAVLIATFIKQLSRQKEHLTDELEKFFDVCHRNAKTPTFLELQTLFSAVVMGFDKVFVVLDALDECELKKRQEFLPYLQGIVTGDATVKLFVASRIEQDIQRAFANVTAIQIEVTKVNKDIQSYVEIELDRRLHDGSLKVGDPGLKHEIFDALIGKADGIFLLVGFQLDHICGQYSDYGIREALLALPENLEQVYTRIIAGVDGNKANRTLAKKVLFWIAYAEQPLTVRQIAEAIAIELGMTNPGDIDHRMINDLEMITKCCANLVQVIPKARAWRELGPTVQFVHYSVKEFLLAAADPDSPRNGAIANKYLLEPQAAHDMITQYCLTYVLCFNNGTPASHSHFVVYAIEYWKKHALAVKCFSNESWKLICQFIHTRNHQLKYSFKYGMKISDSSTMWVTVQNKPYGKVFPPLVNACLLNIPLALERFKNERAEKGGRYEIKATAMHYAVKEESIDAIESLCSMGFAIDVLDDSGTTPLGYARSYKVVELLLDRGANVNAQGGKYGNALQAAVERGNKEVVELLLSRGADVNAQAGRYGNALQAAVTKGWNKEVVELLLDWGADVNARGGKYGNALQAAATEGWNKEVVELLLDRGADVNAQVGRYGNALQAAVEWGMKDVVELLLSRGADARA